MSVCIHIIYIYIYIHIIMYICAHMYIHAYKQMHMQLGTKTRYNNERQERSIDG